MDGTDIWCFPVGVDTATARQNTKRIPRKQGSCKLAVEAPAAERAKKEDLA
jgi:hypothetical protein